LCHMQKEKPPRVSLGASFYLIGQRPILLSLPHNTWLPAVTNRAEGAEGRVRYKEPLEMTGHPTNLQSDSSIKGFGGGSKPRRGVRDSQPRLVGPRDQFTTAPTCVCSHHGSNILTAGIPNGRHREPTSTLHQNNRPAGGGIEPSKPGKEALCSQAC